MSSRSASGVSLRSGAKTWRSSPRSQSRNGSAKPILRRPRIESGSQGLSADFNANSWGGRVETGYRFAMTNGLGVTPFGAVQAQRFETPAYAERDLTGLAAFALNYAARTTTDPVSRGTMTGLLRSTVQARSPRTTGVLA